MTTEELAEKLTRGNAHMDEYRAFMIPLLASARREWEDEAFASGVMAANARASAARAEATKSEARRMAIQTEAPASEDGGLTPEVLDTIQKILEGWMTRCEAAEAERDRLRMQLAACGVVAQSNTRESAETNRKMHVDYWSASCGDVALAVDREMTLREENEALRAGIAELSNASGAHYLDPKYARALLRTNEKGETK